MLHYIAGLLRAVFAASALVKRARATHRYGVGAAGRLAVLSNSAVPPHDFFRPGAVFPVRLRHATLELDDDAGMDIRGAALKLADDDTESPLDIVMNTGEASLFRDAFVFLAFLRAKARGPAGLADLAKAYPHEMAVGVAGFRRAPASFSELHYHSQLIFRFRARDGLPRLVRYRLIPADRGAESGIPLPSDLTHPLRQERLATETRARDYLRRELKDRLARGPVRYCLQIQLHAESPSDPADLLDTSRTWDTVAHPWLDLATVELDRALPDDVTERTRFNIANQPESLGVLRATSPRDYNSIGYLRTRVYPFAQAARRAGKGDGKAAAKAAKASAQAREGAKPAGGHAIHRAVGRLVFQEPGPDGADIPLQHLEVELWDRDFGTPDDFLGRAVTDSEGRFEIFYDPADAGPGDLPDLDLRVVEVSAAHDVGDGSGARRRVVHTVRGADDVAAALYDFGAVRVPYWDYHPGALPRVFVPPGADLPQDFAPGRRSMLIASIRNCADVRARHQIQLTRAPGSLTLAAIQRDYPENLTRRLDRERSGYSRSDEHFGDRMLNGFYPAPLRRDPEREGGFRLAYNFDAYEHRAPYEVASIEALFELRDGSLLPTRLVIQSRLPGGFAPRSPLADPIEVTPRDGARWDQAKRIARVAHFLAGEVDGHLSRAHLDVEQYAVAAFRNLRKNPVRGLLFPHLKEVASINAQGAWLVFGDSGYVPRASALSPRAVEQRFADQMASLDWQTFSPRRPLAPGHRFARVAHLYWDVLTAYIDAYFERHASGIAAHWSEVRAFSRDLVARSVPYSSEGAPMDPSDPHASERDDPSVPRVEVYGVVRAVRPVAAGAHPEARDIENLKRLCRYAIYHATLWHTWINDLQFEDGGDLTYGSLGLRNGGWGPASDDSIGPAPAEASDQLYLTMLLTNVKYGYILRNEDGDIPRELSERLVARRDDFRELGFDPALIRSRINI